MIKVVSLVTVGVAAGLGGRAIQEAVTATEMALVGEGFTVTSSDGDVFGRFPELPNTYRPQDGIYSTEELAQNWGTFYYLTERRRQELPADVDGDGTVSMNDITAVLSAWGRSIPE